jgi:5-hydroxyisourate hydrolase-like protein (transthyretin family)
MVRYICWLLMMAATGFCAGCGQSGPDRVPTYPVVGKVLVDGEPVEMLAIRCVRLSEADKENPTLSQAFTAADGSFKIGTYESKDGVPEGEYALTFQWGEWNLYSHSYGGDKLNDRYSDPAKSEIKFEVVPGEPTDLKTIELTTK